MDKLLMGNTLKNPVTDKETITGTLSSHPRQPESSAPSFAFTSCQGWRITQEDAHFHQTKLHIPADSSSHDNKRDDDGEDTKYLHEHAMIGLFDGHGGSFAAEYASRNFCSNFYLQQEYIDYCRKYLDRQRKMQGSRTRKKKKGKKLRNKDDFSVWTKKVQVLDQDGSLLELLKRALKKTFLEVDRKMLVAMKQMTQHANAVVKVDDWKLTDSSFDLMDAGCAALVVLLTPNHIICANAGDCRAILCKRPSSVLQMKKAARSRPDKKSIHKNENRPDVIPLSFDHKPDNPAEEKRIVQAGGSVSGGKVDGMLALSRGLGDFSFKDHESILNLLSKEGMSSCNGSKTDTGCIPPEQQKVCPLPDFVAVDRDEMNELFLAAACDGIWDVVTNGQCANLISTIFEDGESELGVLSEEVINVCLKKGSRDNMSIFIVKFRSQEISSCGRIGRGSTAAKLNKKMERYNYSI
jgi:serine/threonine protein phosphatase PrpC